MEADDVEEIVTRKGYTALRGAFADVFENEENGFILFAECQRDVPRHLIERNGPALILGRAGDVDSAVVPGILPAGFRQERQVCGNGTVGIRCDPANIL